MTIELQPELEALIRSSLQDGTYQTVDAFLDDAVRQLHDRMSWLTLTRDEVSRRIEQGWASAQRGVLRTEAEVRARMQEHKRVFVNQLSSKK